MQTEFYYHPEHVRRPTALLLSAGSLMLAAACSANPTARDEAPPPMVTASISARPSLEPTPLLSITPTPLASPEVIADCTSVRAVRPNAYYTADHQSAITQQLDLMRLALAPRGNVDIDDDGQTFIALSHQMEEDPNYATAMSEAYRRLSTKPDQSLNAAAVLNFSILPAQLCAPQTLTRAASIEQLNETKMVSRAVGSGLLRHLSAQTSRSGRLVFRALSHEIQLVDDRLTQELNKLRSG